MKRRMLVLAALLVLPFFARADDPNVHHHEAIERPSEKDPPIKITINPEARVSVTLGGALPPPVACGKPATLLVKIVNQGFVTSQLEAELVGEAPAGTALEFHPAPLKGIPEELRELRITLAAPGPTDLTVAFRAHNEVPDLGGRDRVHFILQCVEKIS